MFYTKQKVKEGKHPIGVTTYAPPKPGGSFILNGNALDAWPVLGDFAYIKMLVTLILHRLNEEFVSINASQVGWGPIIYELKNIEYARKFFSRTGSFKAFVKAFMNVNSMSLVALVVVVVSSSLLYPHCLGHLAVIISSSSSYIVIYTQQQLTQQWRYHERCYES
jgi:hypothetical protein